MPDADQIWRDYNTDGVPSTGPYDPAKGDIRTWGLDRELGVAAGRTAARAAEAAALPNGTIVNLGGFLYEVDSTATGTASATNDLSVNGLVPYGTVYAEHYGAVRDGSTDDGPSINAALANHSQVNLLSGSYATGETISIDNRVLYGQGAHSPHRTAIIGLSASLATGEAILKLGRSTVVRGVRIEYDSITGTETQDQRVGLDCRGATFNLQRGAVITEMVFNKVGTAISDFADGAFSVTFGTIEINQHSHAGISLRGSSKTGCYFENIYINDDDNNNPDYGIQITGRMTGSSFGQINVEHTDYAEAAVYFESTHGAHIAALNIEGVDLSTASRGYVRLKESSLRIENLNVLHTRMSQDNTSVVLFDEGGYDTDLGSADSAFHAHLMIGTYNARGLANPDASTYPSYPSGRRGLENITGFEHFARGSGHTDPDYLVSVDNYQWLAYTARAASVPYYQYADTRYSNGNGNIVFSRFGDRGERNFPRENYVGNAAFDTWASTSLSGITTATELATDWYITAATGSIAGSQQDDDFGRDNTYFLRFDTTGTSGNFQWLYHDIPEIEELLDVPCVLSFEMKASSAGRVFEQITASVDNPSGSPTSVFVQVLSGVSSALNAATTWQYYELPFDGASSAGLTLGAGAVIRLNFRINDASGSRESQVDLRNVKVEKATTASRFSRRVRA